MYSCIYFHTSPPPHTPQLCPLDKETLKVYKYSWMLKVLYHFEIPYLNMYMYTDSKA